MAEREDIYESYVKGEKPKKLETQSGIPLKRVYGPQDVQGLDYPRDLGDAGEYPFTRGIHPEMYRGRFWTRRPLTGYGTPRMCNERIKFLYQQGATGFTLSSDSPMHAGVDPDHPVARYGVGLNGVSLSCLEDMEVALEGLPLGKVSVNILCGEPGSAFMGACYVAAAEKQRVSSDKLLGGIAMDPFQQVAGGMMEAEYTFFPMDMAVRMACDSIEWCSLHAPKLNTLHVNSYNLREHGITAVEEIAFGITTATTIAREVLKRGRVKIDDFAPRMSFFCAANMDFLEEIAKFRAFRRIYARTMKEKLGAKDPRSWWFRCAVETSGNSLTTEQPLNNIIRATIESLAAVLGGCQSLFPACFDEGLAIPSELGATLALRTQQIIAHESNVVNSVDPLGGSYLIESLTNKLEEMANELIEEIEGMGGMIEAIRSGWRDKRLIEGKLKFQRDIMEGQQIVVGRNAFRMEEGEVPGGVFDVPPDVAEEREAFIKAFRARRDSQKAGEALKKLGEKARTRENLMPAMVEAVKANATYGEIADTLRQAAGFKIKSAALVGG